MFLSENVLVVVDFRQADHHALPRAFELAKQFGCKLTVVTCVYQDIVDLVAGNNSFDKKQIRQEAMDYFDAALKELAAPFQKECNIDESLLNFEVIWQKSFHEGLLNYLASQSFDLIVKTARSHSALEKLFFTPTDWRLLRDCKTNVLFVKKGAWPSVSNILGAINIDDDVAHQRLNEKIVKTTVEIARACHSRAKILNVFPWNNSSIDKFKYLFEKTDQFLAIKKDHQQALQDFTRDYPELNDNIIVAEGLEPAETIPEIVKSSVSDLLVIGCVRRKGLSGMMIGNTVEKILDDIKCEVLVIK